MSINQFLKENGNNKSEEKNVQNGSEDEEQHVGEENAYQDEDGVNTIEGKCLLLQIDNIFFSYLCLLYNISFNEFNVKIGTSKKKAQGQTQCLVYTWKI